MRAGRQPNGDDWERLDLEAQRARQRDVPIEERLQEVLAWSAALLADELERFGGRPVEWPMPVELGRRLAAYARR